MSFANLFGVRVVEDPRMFPGAYFFKDAKGKILATGMLSGAVSGVPFEGGFMPEGDTTKTTQIVCGSSAYSAIKASLKEEGGAA